jgi:hypothetical protein
MTAEKDAVAAVAAFHREFDRWPSAVSKDDQERRLGIWLNRQRIELANGRLDEFRKAVFDAQLTGWNITADEAWMASAREASDFYLRYGRGPEPDAEDAAEKHIGLWVKLQRSMVNAAIMRPERGRWLAEHCPGWEASRPAATGHAL